MMSEATNEYKWYGERTTDRKGETPALGGWRSSIQTCSAAVLNKC